MIKQKPMLIHEIANFFYKNSGKSRFKIVQRVDFRVARWEIETEFVYFPKPGSSLLDLANRLKAMNKLSKPKTEKTLSQQQLGKCLPRMTILNFGRALTPLIRNEIQKYYGGRLKPITLEVRQYSADEIKALLREEKWYQTGDTLAFIPPNDPVLAIMISDVIKETGIKPMLVDVHDDSYSFEFRGIWEW